MWLIRKLKKLVEIPQQFEKSSSGHLVREIRMIQYLRQWNKKLNVDSVWNLFIINPGKPLICAHMDTVQSENSCKLITQWWLTIKDWVMSCKGADIWWDDKCWLAIAMQLYEELWDEISILFTVWEETWWHWINQWIKDNAGLLDDIPYCIVPDRRFWWDIIWYQNWYCSKEFQDAIVDIIWTRWFKPTNGLFCDADKLAPYINCINISCGYYEPHSINSTIRLDELQTTYRAIYTIVCSLEWTYPIYTKPKYSSNNRWWYRPETYKGHWKKKAESLFDKDIEYDFSLITRDADTQMYIDNATWEYYSHTEYQAMISKFKWTTSWDSDYRVKWTPYRPALPEHKSKKKVREAFNFEMNYDRKNWRLFCSKDIVILNPKTYQEIKMCKWTYEAFIFWKENEDKEFYLTFGDDSRDYVPGWRKY